MEIQTEGWKDKSILHEMQKKKNRIPTKKPTKSELDSESFFRRSRRRRRLLQRKKFDE